MAQAQNLTMVVSEGASSGDSKTKMVSRYAPLANLLSSTLGGQRVDVVAARDFGSLQDEIQKQHYDFVFTRPAESGARAVRENGYKYVATGAPDTRCLLITPAGNAIKSAAQLKGSSAKLVFPERASYLSRVCLRELKDLQIDADKLNINYVKEQGVVIDYLDHKLADVGAVGSFAGVAKKWIAEGKPVIFKGRPVSLYPLVAGPKITAKQVTALQNALNQFHNTDAGRAFFDSVGMESFDTLSAGRLQESLKWLENR